MLAKVNNIPKEFHGIKDIVGVWACFNELDPYGDVCLQEIEANKVAIHLNITTWYKSLIPVMIDDFKYLLTLCQNYDYIVASNPDVDDKRWRKFIKLFGCPKPIKMQISVMEIK